MGTYLAGIRLDALAQEFSRVLIALVCAVRVGARGCVFRYIVTRLGTQSNHHHANAHQDSRVDFLAVLVSCVTDANAPT